MGEKGVWGNDTPEKQKDFRAMLSHHINVCRQIYEKRRKFDNWILPPYVYIDCFGGPGIMGDNLEIKGSPVIFDELCQELGDMGYNRFIFERDLISYRSLVSVVGQNGIFNQDCRQVLNTTKMAKHKWQYGLAYIDSDMSEDDMYHLSIDLVRHISRNYKTIDIMLYVSPNTLKRIRAASGRNIWLSDLVKSAKKDHWAVREPKGKNQYTFLIGTNYKGWADWKNLGFHLTDSKKGKLIFEKVNFTEKEIKKKVQMSFLHTVPILNTLRILNIKKYGRRP